MNTLLLTRLRNLFQPKRHNAAKRWQQAGGGAQHAFWLWVHPIHLTLGRDSFFLNESAPLMVSNEESAAIIASLNQHFNTRGLYFYQQDTIWFLGLEFNPHVQMSPLALVKNKDIAPFLPQGDGALAWATLQNEMQMLLFGHPVNRLREQQDQLVINSLWCDSLGQSV